MADSRRGVRDQAQPEWCRLLGDAGLRFAPVRDHAEVAADPGVAANGYIERVQDPGASGSGTVRPGSGPVLRGPRRTR